MGNNRVLLISLLLLIASQIFAQDPVRFKEEVEEIVQRNDSLWDQQQETIVFTGSSSIRFWEDLERIYPAYQILNTGFGGSHASDLLVYTDPLILRYQPRKVFIYEGDNDLSQRKRPRRIMKDIGKILGQIWVKYPETEVVLISAKPSIVRWHLRSAYKRLNRKFERLAAKQPKLEYADVWSVMLQKRKLKEDLFVKDGLHMNNKGYELWKQVIDPHVKLP